MSKKATPPPLPQTPREVRFTGPGATTVIWPVANRRGLQRIGSMVPGVEYTVAPDLAVRLVDVKGFDYASASDAAIAAVHIAKRKAATPATDTAAATAPGAGGGTYTKDEE